MKEYKFLYISPTSYPKKFHEQEITYCLEEGWIILNAAGTNHTIFYILEREIKSSSPNPSEL